LVGRDRFAYRQHSATLSNEARDARARAWAFVFSCAKKNAAGRTSTNGGDEKERSRNDSLAKTRIP
jgi:hypothetical protein